MVMQNSFQCIEVVALMHLVIFEIIQYQYTIWTDLHNGWDHGLDGSIIQYFGIIDF